MTAGGASPLGRASFAFDQGLALEAAQARFTASFARACFPAWPQQKQGDARRRLGRL